MGKSPGKWIKTLLFGKKSARSNATNGRDASLQKSGTDKGYTGGKGPPALAGNSPVISEPVLVSTGNNEITPNLEKGTPSNLDGDGVVLSATSQDAEKRESAGYEASNDPEKLREEQAAIKAQTAFRGYLARRAFHALKGIIRLQALIRGHLVRRQAVATLRAWQAIVKFQAVVRGRRVRCSGIGFKIHTKLAQGNTADAKSLDSWKEKLLTNAFFRKLLSSSHIAKPLQIQYDQGDPNSVFSWLERWTSTHFRKLLERPKKTTDSKPQTRRCSYAMETESGRSKRSVRRNSAMNVDSAQTNVTSEPEKTKRNLRKASGSPADLVQDHPQTEIEKVKRNLRKVSNSITEGSDRLEVETEKPIRNVRKVSSSPSDAPDQGLENSAEKIRKGVVPTPENKPEVETVSRSAVMEGLADALPDDSSATESHRLQRIDNEEKALVVNGELSSMEEQPCLESQKAKKRRSSFSARSENAENGLQNTPVLPSYMATTESSKAKFRGQISPRFGSDLVDKYGITRRHSLPSSTNDKSCSPRTQRLFPANGKGGNRSFFSSRDGNERAIRVEWRR